ncbi:MAG: hypothetical protein MJ212_02410, partial [Alphaproteobacteria bacterium]|nr:hypothetical protein [Alphaproteobacteria bacterium]
PKQIYPLKKVGNFSGYLYKVVRDRSDEVRSQIKRKEREMLDNMRAAQDMADDFGFMLRP